MGLCQKRARRGWGPGWPHPGLRIRARRDPAALPRSEPQPPRRAWLGAGADRRAAREPHRLDVALVAAAVTGRIAPLVHNEVLVPGRVVERKRPDAKNGRG